MNKNNKTRKSNNTLQVLIHASSNIVTHENTSTSANTKIIFEDNVTGVLFNVSIISITTVRITIMRETANTTAALQDIQEKL